MSRVFLRIAFAIAIFATAPRAAVASPADEFFENRIRPILANHCYSCHSDKAGKSKGGLKLDSRAAIISGGDSGSAVVVGKPEDSLLIKAVRRKDDVVSAMPADTPLTDAQVKDLEKWIVDGVAFPDTGSKPKEDPLKHWAFQNVRNPPVPTVKATDRKSVV